MNDEDCYHIDILDDETDVIQDGKDTSNTNTSNTNLFTFAATTTSVPIIPEYIPGVLYTIKPLVYPKIARNIYTR